MENSLSVLELSVLLMILTSPRSNNDRLNGVPGIQQAKSSTKPSRIEYLDGIEMLDISAGQHTTYFIARPPPTEAAQEEAKNLESVPLPSSSTPAAPPPLSAIATEETPSDSPTSPAFKPSIDLSGFGFAFGAPPSASAPEGVPTDSNSKVATPPEVSIEERKKNAIGISRTVQAAWEELPRYPAVYDARDECLICDRVENESKGDSLECEKVRRPPFPCSTRLD
jgi:hypothetical protein